jgi:peptidyl-prolyl cis-trans isomerase SurA
LEDKVRKDERSMLITNSLAKKLRAKYTQTKDKKVLASVKKAVTEDFYAQTWELPTNLKDFEATLLTINKSKQISAASFLNFVQSQQKSKIKTKPVSKLVDELFEKFIDEQVTVYNNENLEKEFPEFSYVMDEYRDGLLLFDLMDKEIWTKAKIDTVGLTNYYNDNIKNYQWKKRFNVNIFSSTDEKVILNAKKLLENGNGVKVLGILQKDQYLLTLGMIIYFGLKKEWAQAMVMEEAFLRRNF